MVVQTTRDLGYYTPIAEKVLQARKNFLAWADSLPSPIGETIKEMAKGNREAPLPGNLFGECVAFTLGELFAVSEEQQQIAALGCIAGYAYAIHQDGLIDGDQETMRYHELARNYLYAKALESFQTASGKANPFWTYWKRYLTEYSEGCLAELAKARTMSPYGSEDLKMVAHRSGLVKICAAAYAIATRQLQELPRYEVGIDELAMGLQIRDDLADCLADAEKGRYSYVMSRLDDGRSREGRKIPSGYSTYHGIARPGVVETLLAESINCFLRAGDHYFRLKSDAALRLYLNHLIAENVAIQEVVNQARDTATEAGLPHMIHKAISPKVES